MCHAATPCAFIQVSIADFLASQGYDVWVVDIRGNGRADKVSRVDIEQDWNIDDYLVQVCGSRVSNV